MKKKTKIMSNKEYFEKFFETLDQEWIVRVVVCEMNNERQGIMNILGKITTDRFVHVGIQIGPYIIDWLKNSEVRIRCDEESTSILYFNPNKHYHSIKPNLEMRTKIVNFIFENRHKKYDTEEFNSNLFASLLLQSLKIYKGWIKRSSPITTIDVFITEINEAPIDIYELNYYETRKSITNPAELKEFWLLIQDQLKKKDLEIDPYLVFEIIDIVKILEKRYMAISKDNIEPLDYNYYDEHEILGDEKVYVL